MCLRSFVLVQTVVVIHTVIERVISTAVCIIGCARLSVIYSWSVIQNYTLFIRTIHTRLPMLVCVLSHALNFNSSLVSVMQL